MHNLHSEETAFVDAVLILSHFHFCLWQQPCIQQCATTIGGCEAQGLLGTSKDESLYIFNVALPN